MTKEIGVSLKTAADAHHQAMLMANGATNARDHLVHVSAHLSQQGMETHTTLAAMKQASDQKLNAIDQKLESILSTQLDSGKLGSLTNECCCPTCLEVYNGSDMIVCSVALSTGCV